MSNLPSEPEFEQAYKELASTLENSTLFQQHPEYRKALKIASIPERVIQFRVVWEDDKGELQVNRGYRVQFNSALGPYKGGLRFHPSVNLSILKFLGFEQIFKNALTGLNMGGGKGGADFDPKGKSDNEIRKFCVGFMTELSRHIGADTDVPAGDIGVSPREIGFMFGQYKKIRNQWEGVLTGKGLSWGGSLIRPEATGFGLVYYVQHMIQHASKGSETFAGKRVVISGSGNVAQYAALKVIELGGTVVSLSDSQGSLITESPEGFTPAEIEGIAALKVARKQLSSIFSADADAHNNTLFSQSKFKYIPNVRPWLHVGKVDVALPCATQNEISSEEAQGLIDAGVKYVAEGSNMGSTQGAIDIFEAHRESNKNNSIWYAPGKAANLGGVAVSGLEMAQNSARLNWTREEVDRKLQDIMKSSFENGLETAKRFVSEGEEVLPSLVAGSNIAGFMKVAAAMKDQGDWW
uniref:Glutamate dehydrogenase n=1 Tax=Talaromyces purpureogenus TaxID=1266744 RepID=K0IVW4_TALPU|nr:putative NADP-specific glutamate dehydrogenase [Talaromyces purpureogenus]